MASESLYSAVVGEGHVGFAANDGDGRAELVRGVGDEAAHGFERLVEARQQLVERGRQDQQFFGGAADFETPVQIAAGDLAGLLGHPIEGGEAVGGEQVAADPSQAEEQRQGQEGDAADHAEIGGDGIQGGNGEDQEGSSQSFQMVGGGARAIRTQSRQRQDAVRRGAGGHHGIRFLLRDWAARRQ
jgi:hypothetical protein